MLKNEETNTALEAIIKNNKLALIVYLRARRGNILLNEEKTFLNEFSILEQQVDPEEFSSIFAAIVGNHGNALLRLAMGNSGNLASQYIDDAINQYGKVLKYVSIENTRARWIRTQKNLSVAKWLKASLAENENQPAVLNDIRSNLLMSIEDCQCSSFQTDINAIRANVLVMNNLKGRNFVLRDYINFPNATLFEGEQGDGGGDGGGGG